MTLSSHSGAVASPGSRVRKAVTPVVEPLWRLLDALNGLTQVQTQSVKIGMDPMLSTFAKTQAQAPLFQRAGDACQQAIEALQAAVDSAIAACRLASGMGGGCLYVAHQGSGAHRAA